MKRISRHSRGYSSKKCSCHDWSPEQPMINPFMARASWQEHSRNQTKSTQNPFLDDIIQQYSINVRILMDLGYAHTVTSCIFKPGFLSGSNSAARTRVDSKMCCFSRIVSLSHPFSGWNQTSCLLTWTIFVLNASRMPYCHLKQLVAVG